jgi:pimeloyl-ACP methyl ester carboxylesterase
MANMSNRILPTLQAHKDVAVWSGGTSLEDIEVWFLHGFGESHLCFRDAFAHPLAERMRIFLFDLPGCGASPPRQTGLTIEDAAQLCLDLIESFSSSRRIVLVGHSVGGIIATRVALMRDPSPDLVISVEGNLTPSDAYFSGQAANFDEPEPYYTWLRSKILAKEADDDIFRRYSCSLQLADPRTLWTLGRSVAGDPNPGQDFLSLTCPSIYYWDPASTSDAAKQFLDENDIRQRKLEGLGHWPMISSPSRFYAAVEQDVLSTVPG